MGYKRKAEITPEQELTHKELVFVTEYFKSMCNATVAAMNAGYTDTSKHGGGIGFRLLQQPNIKRYVEEVKNDLGRKLGITRERVALELAKVAFFNIKSIFTEEGKLKPIQEIDHDAAAAISGIEVESIGKDDQPFQLLRSKYKIHDKIEALKTINKMLGYDAVPQPVTLGPDGQPLTGMPTLNVQINNFTNTPPRTDLDG